MSTLYEITGDYSRVMAFEVEDEADAEAFLALLDEVQDRFEDKAHRICMVLRNIEADAEAYKSEADRLAARRKAAENKAARLKDYLQRNMAAMEQRDVKTPLFSLKIQKNPPALDVFNPALVPADYYVQPEPVLSRELVKKAIGDGFEVPGARIVQRESLRIR